MATKDTATFGTVTSVIYTIEAEQLQPVQLNTYAVAFSSLNTGDDTVINRSLTQLDVEIYCKADVIRDHAATRVHVAVALMKFNTDTPNEVRFKHKLKSVVFVVPGGGSQIIDLDLMDRERQINNTSFASVSFLSSEDTVIRPTMTNRNGTLMNRVQAQTLFDSYATDPEVRSSFSFSY